MNNVMYNPAASHDLGTHAWAVGDACDADTIKQYDYPHLCYLDVDTALHGYKHIAAQYEAFLNAPVEDAVQQLDNMFDEVMPCLSSQQL